MGKKYLIFHRTARSIFRNYGEFQKSVDETNPHGIYISGTWLHSNNNLGLKG